MRKLKNKIIVIFSSHLGDEKNNEFINHIHNTIGVKHDVICYTNYNEFSLTKIYNNAIDKYHENNVIMVFCHPDIIIKTKNWGKILLGKFNNTDFDIIGVAGSTYMDNNGVWWHDRSKMCGIVEHTNGISTWVSEYSSEIHGVKEVVVIDGLFMAVDCSNIIHRFDEDFVGFHFYEISMVVPNYLEGCNIGVTTSIRILHKSVGETNQQWEANRQQFVKRYDDELPIALPPQYKELNPILKSFPKVTVIIPTKNNFKYISNNITSWGENVTYPNYEILVADTGSSQDVIDSYSVFLRDKVKLVRYDYYNFAKINNDVVKNHVSDDTELLLFCNDDVRLLNDVLSRCVEIYNENKATVGTIGIRLHFGDGSVQHNGIIMGFDSEKQLKLSHRDIRKTEGFQTGVNYNSLGNTGGFMLIKKDLFNTCGGFNEEYVECLEDVELNLKCRHQGLQNITVSDAVAYHYESVSRDKLSGKNERFMVDFERLLLFIKNNVETKKLIIL
jgi:GT2 family glycosyltransferase